MKYFRLKDENDSVMTRIIKNLIVLLIVVAIMVAIVVPTFFSYRKTTNSKNENAIFSGFSDAELQDLVNYDTLTDTAIVLNARVTAVDPINQLLKLNVQFVPCGNLTFGSAAALNAPVTVNSDSDAKFYANGSRLPTTDYSIAMFGEVSYYPLDSYDASFALNLMKGAGANATAIHTPVLLNAVSPQFNIISNITQSIDPTDGSEYYLLTFTVKRAPTTIAFSAIVIILLWFLSLGSCLVTLQFILYKRAIDLPILALNATLLFAMPALRNTQPSIPPIGIAVDVISFFFNMCLVAISFLCILSLYFIRWQPPKTEKSNA
ncbi:hypothetical protein BC940DRAFT_286893 [Gongronella butleri]|nr:hypothetical protein BC940DRAFT_286893 [Gongronella butleri]